MLPEGPQSGDSTENVGSGNLEKAGSLTKSFASRPLALEKRVPRQPSMKGGIPILTDCLLEEVLVMN